MSKMSWNLSICYLPPTTARYSLDPQRKIKPYSQCHLFTILFLIIPSMPWFLKQPVWSHTFSWTLTSSCHHVWPDNCRTISLLEMSCFQLGKDKGVPIRITLGLFCSKCYPRQPPHSREGGGEMVVWKTVLQVILICPLNWKALSKYTSGEIKDLNHLPTTILSITELI